jgi:hypothetical protein
MVVNSARTFYWHLVYEYCACNGCGTSSGDPIRPDGFSTLSCTCNNKGTSTSIPNFDGEDKRHENVSLARSTLIMTPNLLNRGIRPLKYFNV